ncbi:MAG: methyltransferase domain-containing protein [Nanoarchaeota archaeon]
MKQNSRKIKNFSAVNKEFHTLFPIQKLFLQKEELCSFWRAKGFEEKTIAAFCEIPRELFVAAELTGHAYDDIPLPTTRGQSISQPTTIMLMLQALDVQEGQSILEIGAGVGFQACILAKLVGSKGRITTIEIIPELVQAAKRNAARLGFPNIMVVEGDGSLGIVDKDHFEDHFNKGMFDRVIITAACPQIPPLVIEQTKEQGIIVAPVGDLHGQVMVKAIKVNDRLDFEFLGTFLFVPMQGKYGLEKDLDAK